MPHPTLPRKLAAILHADVAGYSRLTGADEEGTHQRLRHGLDIISALIDRYHGAINHFAGDAVLANFDTVTAALTAALAIQEALEAEAQETSSERAVRFRIGVNLGEVIVDGAEIYGDGVNVAQRLEQLAPPGGICVSDAVRVAAGSKLAVRFAFAGERQVKNISEPVRTYLVESTTAAPVTDDAALGAALPGREETGWKLHDAPITHVADGFASPPQTQLQGRADDLEAITRHLSEVADGSKMVFLEGAIGVGKSALAVSWWRRFRERADRSERYTLAFDCGASEGTGRLALDIGHLVFDQSREFLERNHGRIIDQLVAVAKRRDVVLVLDNLERVQAGPSAGEFRDYIRGDVGRLLLRLMHAECRARILVCSQRPAPQLDWDISGRILHLRVQPLDQRDGARLVQDVVEQRGVRIADSDALALSRSERGVPLNLIGAALAHAQHGEQAQLRSVAWSHDGFEDNLARYLRRLSPGARLVLRILSLSEEGLTDTTLRWVLEQPDAGVRLERSASETIRTGVEENEPIIASASAHRDGPRGTVYQIAHDRFRNYFRAAWEKDPEAAPVVRRIHRLLARVAWYRAEGWRRADRPSAAGFEGLEALTYPPDPHPYEGSLRALRRYLQCLHHLLASVDASIFGSDTGREVTPLGPDDAAAAMHLDASAALSVRFAYEVIYLQIIERGGQWYLTRGLGADDTRIELLARFFRLGSSTLDLSAGLMPSDDGGGDTGPALPLLPRFLNPTQQGNLLFSLGIAAHRMGEATLAVQALNAAFAQRTHHDDQRGAAKVLTTIADLNIQNGRIREWRDKCSYYLWEFARWDPDFEAAQLGAIDDDAARDRARIVAELLGRFAHATMMVDGAHAALAYFTRAQSIRQRLGGERGFLDGNVGRRYGQALLRVGEPGPAEERNQHARRRHRGKRHELALLAVDRASILRALGRLTHARIALGEAEELTRSSGTGRAVLFEYQLEAARLAIETGRGPETVDVVEDVHWRARSRGLALLECDAALLLAEAHAGAAEQQRYLRMARQLVDRSGYGYRKPDLQYLSRGESAVGALTV